MLNPSLPIRVIAIGLTATVAILGCSEVKDIIDPPTPVPTSVQLSQATVALTALGATATLTATVRDQNGNAISGSSVTWSSNAEDVATVSTAGTVTAVAVGTAMITATSGSLSEDATVTVTQEAAAAEPVGGDAQTGTVGQALGMPLTVQINDAGGNPIPDVAVTFAVTSGGGSVFADMVPTDATGQASTTWTLGNGAGEQQVTATAGGQTTMFTATGTPDVPASIAEVSGNMQQGPTGAQLASPIVVKVADQFGNGVDGQAVAFAITGGDGSLSSASGTTDAAGEASTMWTLGSSEGQNSAEASVAGITGSPVMFTATGTNLAVTSVSPDPIVEGGTATISGQGFSPIPGNNTVTVDGVTANVTSALLNTIEIDVPTFDCRPARMVNVMVTVGGVSEGISHPMRPTQFFSVPVGEQVIISDPSAFCLQFDGTASDERFLVGVTSVSELPSSRTAVTVTGVTSSGSTAPPLMAMSSRPAGQSLNLSREQLRRIDWMERHRAVESRLMMQSLRQLPLGAPPAAPGMKSSVPSDIAEGDTVDIQVPSFADLCNTFTTVTTVARKIGTSGVWLEDIANDANGFSAADFQTFSDKLDELIYATDTRFFGDPPDVDGNDRLVAVITKEVNKTEGLGGYVSSADFFAQSTCPASNVGEIFYGIAPDAENAVAALLPFMPVLIAHEFVHVIQLGRRIFANASVFPSVWELEGGATFGENAVGIVAEGLGPNAMDLDNSTVFDFPGTASGTWFAPMALHVAQYLGINRTMSPPGRHGEAPHDCTWLDREVLDDECTLDGNEPYGVPASFLWWIADQFGPTYTGGVGGVEGIQQAIIDNSNLAGFDNIVDIIGVPIDSLLMQWQAAFYMDNRMVDGMVIPSNPRLTFKTWNFFSILENTTLGGTSLRMTPKALSFADASQSIFVRGGSTGFFLLLTGNGRLATALRVRDAADGTLPSNMRLWVTGLK